MFCFICLWQAGFWPNYGWSIHIPFAVKGNFKVQNLKLGGYLGENWIEIYDPFSTVPNTFIIMLLMIMIEIREQEETLKIYWDHYWVLFKQLWTTLFGVQHVIESENTPHLVYHMGSFLYNSSVLSELYEI